VSGVVASSMGGALTGLHIVVTPAIGGALPAVTTTADGRYSVPSVPLGPGSVSVTGSAPQCTFPDTALFTLFADTVTANVIVRCHGATGYIAGIVNNPVNGGPITGSITVTPSGQPALGPYALSENGQFFLGVPLPVTNGSAGTGSGMITVAGSLPFGCTAPAPLAYNGLGNGDTITVSMSLSCLSGTLNLNISTVPGVEPVVMLSGPPTSGPPTPYYVSSQTLKGLVPGTYTASLPARDVTFDTILGTYGLGTLTGSPAFVAPGGSATITAAYVARGGSGQAWLASGGRATGYTPANLANGASSGRAISVGGAPRSVAFDTAGNLWLAVGSQVVEYAASTLPLTSGAYTPPSSATWSFTLPGTAAAAAGLAFDAASNLWVADVHNARIYEYAASTLASNAGSPAPQLTISSTGPNGAHQYLQAPFRMAFDGNGRLWVADTIAHAALGSTQLATSGAPVPIAVSTVTAFPGGGPYALAFDEVGYDLWLGGASAEGPPGQDSGLFATVEFSAPPYGTDSVPLIVGSFPAAPFPSGTGPASPPVVDMAFYAAGGVWVLGNNSLVDFTLVLGRMRQPALPVTAVSGVTAFAFDVTSLYLPLIGGASRAASHRPVSISSRVVRRPGNKGVHNAIHGPGQGQRRE
jgi:hypothetical protein